MARLRRAAEARWHQRHPGVVDNSLSRLERARPPSDPQQPADAIDARRSALSGRVAASTSCSLCRTPLHDWSLARDVAITSRRYYANTLATHPRESGMVRQSLFAQVLRRLSTWQIAASCPTADSPRRCLQSADVPTWAVTATDFCSRWTSLVELSSGPAAQSRRLLYGLFRPFSGNMNTALCDFWYAAP